MDTTTLPYVLELIPQLTREQYFRFVEPLDYASATDDELIERAEILHGLMDSMKLYEHYEDECIGFYDLDLYDQRDALIAELISRGLAPWSSVLREPLHFTPWSSALREPLPPTSDSPALSSSPLSSCSTHFDSNGSRSTLLQYLDLLDRVAQSSEPSLPLLFDLLRAFGAIKHELPPEDHLLVLEFQSQAVDALIGHCDDPLTEAMLMRLIQIPPFGYYTIGYTTANQCPPALIDRAKRFYRTTLLHWQSTLSPGAASSVSRCHTPSETLSPGAACSVSRCHNPPAPQ